MRVQSGRKSRTVSRLSYVYCIIPSRKNLSFTYGKENREINTIHYKDIAAVVTDAWKDKYEILDDGLSHEMVVEMFQKNYCVLPMGFGQVSTEQDIKAFLNRNYTRIKTLMDQLEGKIELGVRVVWKQEAALKEIIKTDKKIKALQSRIADKPEHVAHKLKIEIGKTVADQLEKRGEDIAFDFCRHLGPISAASACNKTLSPQMLMNAAFLVKTDDVGDFDMMVDEMEEKYRPLVSVKYIVSPPYNFSNLRVNR